MKVVSSLADAAPKQPSVISIGNFDGLHLGHEAILKTVVERARELGVRAAAMTFSPHPIRFLAPDKAPKLISTMEQKIRLIESTGIDLLFVAKFDEAFSRLSPEEYIRQYLEDGFQARSVCVGSNFNFGYRQTGTVETLKQWKGNLEVIEVPPVRVRGVLASSTRVRELIARGRISTACRLLGRWLQVEGPIVSGAGRGRRVTVPTLNMKPENELIPKIGVYASRISIDSASFVDSITNVGVRPTFDEHELTVETFVIDGTVPPAPAAARLKFLWRLRDEIKFDSPEALRRQIANDVDRCRKFFRLLGSFSHAGHHLLDGCALSGLHSQPLIQVEVYSRAACHLCDDAKDVIERVQRRVPFSMRVINIEEDPELEARYGTEIPVVFINGNKAFKYRVDEAELEKKVKRLWNT